LTLGGDLDLAKNSKVVGGNRMSLLSGIDPNTNNVSSAVRGQSSSAMSVY
jgi:hypothetical protein